ncbi:unnamed protein product [Meganyctiphanes norvegica]|uniref:PDF receptor n=1 Tax=Meganyctiphanes norvegica TaxID=48144 RepID=A0AAV2R1J3_MEGNR
MTNTGNPQIATMIDNSTVDVTSIVMTIWCNITNDTVSCWPKEPARSLTILYGLKGVSPKLVERRCLPEGIWDGREVDGPQGWTNYTPCLIPEMIKLMERLFANSEEDAKLKLQVAEAIRVVETVGLALSLVTILVSIFIFSYYRSLRNNRTRMHLNLFVAMMIQMVVRLTVYIDQYVTRQNPGSKESGIESLPVLCEAFYVLLEYARTVVFLWMFIEGHYLHSMLTITVFSEPNQRMYFLLGWGFPIIHDGGLGGRHSCEAHRQQVLVGI